MFTRRGVRTEAGRTVAGRVRRRCRPRGNDHEHLSSGCPRMSRESEADSGVSMKVSRGTDSLFSINSDRTAWSCFTRQCLHRSSQLRSRAHTSGSGASAPHPRPGTPGRPLLTRPTSRQPSWARTSQGSSPGANAGPGGWAAPVCWHSALGAPPASVTSAGQGTPRSAVGGTTDGPAPPHTRPSAAGRRRPAGGPTPTALTAAIAATVDDAMFSRMPRERSRVSRRALRGKTPRHESVFSN